MVVASCWVEAAYRPHTTYAKSEHENRSDVPSSEGLGVRVSSEHLLTVAMHTPLDTHLLTPDLPPLL